MGCIRRGVHRIRSAAGDGRFKRSRRDGRIGKHRETVAVLPAFLGSMEWVDTETRTTGAGTPSYWIVAHYRTGDTVTFGPVSPPSEGPPPSGAITTLTLHIGPNPVTDGQIRARIGIPSSSDFSDDQGAPPVSVAVPGTLEDERQFEGSHADRAGFEEALLEVSLHDVSGRAIYSESSRVHAAGEFQWVWRSGMDGPDLASGVYYVRALVRDPS